MSPFVYDYFNISSGGARPSHGITITHIFSAQINFFLFYIINMYFREKVFTIERIHCL